MYDHDDDDDDATTKNMFIELKFIVVKWFLVYASAQHGKIYSYCINALVFNNTFLFIATAVP